MALRRIRKRRSASITSLIDVIFLLLLFFMLASTFNRRAEIELVASAAEAGAAQEVEVIEVTVEPDALRVGGQTVAIDNLVSALSASIEDPSMIIAIDLAEDVTTQRLVDVLMTLRGLDGANVHVMEPS